MKKSCWLPGDLTVIASPNSVSAKAPNLNFKKSEFADVKLWKYNPIKWTAKGLDARWFNPSVWLYSGAIAIVVNQLNERQLETMPHLETMSYHKGNLRKFYTILLSGSFLLITSDHNMWSP